jgi:hypothetical protein
MDFLEYFVGVELSTQTDTSELTLIFNKEKCHMHLVSEKSDTEIVLSIKDQKKNLWSYDNGTEIMEVTPIFVINKNQDKTMQIECIKATIIWKDSKSPLYLYPRDEIIPL